jgi:hypothetical protein
MGISRCNTLIDIPAQDSGRDRHGGPSMSSKELIRADQLAIAAGSSELAQAQKMEASAASPAASHMTSTICHCHRGNVSMIGILLKIQSVTAARAL